MGLARCSRLSLVVGVYSLSETTPWGLVTMYVTRWGTMRLMNPAAPFAHSARKYLTGVVPFSQFVRADVMEQFVFCAKAEALRAERRISTSFIVSPKLRIMESITGPTPWGM